jgi:hypothetical protein
VFRPSSRQTINIVKQIDFSYHTKKDDMDRTRENLLSEPTISSLYGMICCSFIQNLPLLKILRQYSLDNLWQANMVNIVLSQGSTQISELLDSNMENYPIETSHPDQISVKPTDWKYQPHKIISGVRMWAVPEVNYEPNHPMAGPLSYLLDSATMSQKVEFIYHHKAMREIATFDNDNKVLIRK